MPEVHRVTEQELASLGERLGGDLAPGSVVHLVGELGSGKTTLVRAIARGLGATDAVSSPTYALVHHYHGARGDVYHVDCFRLRAPAEAADLDWETLAAADALLIEWPERAGTLAPPATLTVSLAHLPADELRREVQLT